MSEYKSPFVNALAERWLGWRPMVEDAIGRMPLMYRTIVRSALDTFDILNHMPELLRNLDEDNEKRRMIEGEIRALALEAYEPPPIEVVPEDERIDHEAEPETQEVPQFSFTQPKEDDLVIEEEPEPEIEEKPSEEAETFEVPEGNIIPGEEPAIVDISKEHHELEEERPAEAVPTAKTRKKRKTKAK